MVRLVSNNAIEHFLVEFRDKSSSIQKVNNSVDIISTFLAGEASNFVNAQKTSVNTPIGLANGLYITTKIQIVPVIRAGLAMLSAFCRIFPNALVGPIWLSRNKDLTVKVHAEKLQSTLTNFTSIIIDPMLATGGTASTVIELAKKRGATDIILVNILATPLGIAKITETYDIPIITVKDNESLDDDFYVYPGVGDSGDRLFGNIDH